MLPSELRNFRWPTFGRRKTKSNSQSSGMAMAMYFISQARDGQGCSRNETASAGSWRGWVRANPYRNVMPPAPSTTTLLPTRRLLAVRSQRRRNLLKCHQETPLAHPAELDKILERAAEIQQTSRLVSTLALAGLRMGLTDASETD